MKYFVLIVLKFLVYFVGVNGLSVEWRHVAYPSELLLHQTEPVGMEGSGNVLFLCRANHNGHWTPGQLQITEGSFHCTIPYDSKVYDYAKFQVIYAPPGVTSWIPVSTSDTLPNTAVVGGSDGDFPVLNICRVQHGNNILTGKYAHNGYSGECFYAYDGREYKTGQTEVEVLVINAFGVFAGVNQTTELDEIK